MARFLLISCAGVLWCACGPPPDPSLYSAKLNPIYPPGEVVMDLPGETVSLPRSITKADDNGNPALFQPGRWGNRSFCSNFCSEVTSDPPWIVPQIIFTPADGEEHTVVTLDIDGKLGVAAFDNLWAPFGLRSVGTIRAGQAVVLELSAGAATLSRPVGSISDPGFLTLAQGTKQWFWNALPTTVGQPDHYIFEGNQVRFTMAADVQPGTLQGTIVLQRTPVVASCQGFRECGGSVVKQESFTLEISP
ncbi:MAG TPA: hypothetical protein VIG99_12235 [Myxococcaceae bacterium]